MGEPINPLLKEAGIVAALAAVPASMLSIYYRNVLDPQHILVNIGICTGLYFAAKIGRMAIGNHTMHKGKIGDVPIYKWCVGTCLTTCALGLLMKDVGYLDKCIYFTISNAPPLVTYACFAYTGFHAGK